LEFISNPAIPSPTLLYSFDFLLVLSPSGSAGRFGPFLLAAQKGSFETGMHDVFSLTTPELGQVVELALSQNDTGCSCMATAAWQVDRAELENKNTGGDINQNLCFEGG